MRVLITGGSGTLGSSIAKLLAKDSSVSEIIIFSRSEEKQIALKNNITSNKLVYVIGDIRDYQSFIIASKNVDLVIHTAAIKHIDIAEQNPVETASINIAGLSNIINAVKINNIKKLFFVSTDKASLPSGIYGASKLVGEKMVIASSNEKNQMSVFRFGNIIGSSGSIFQRWPEQLERHNKIYVTDKNMTRFFIEKDDAAKYIISKIHNSAGSEIFIPKMKKKKIFDIAISIAKDPNKIEIIGLRKSEKMHENILSKTELGLLYENSSEYIIFPGTEYLKDISSGD